MNIRAWTIVLASAATFAAAPASALVVMESTPHAKPVSVALVKAQPELAALHRATMVNNAQLSELPEPEVIVMMLVGLVLIGYRASRDSSEKFE